MKLLVHICRELAKENIRNTWRIKMYFLETFGIEQNLSSSKRNAGRNPNFSDKEYQYLIRIFRIILKEKVPDSKITALWFLTKLHFTGGLQSEKYYFERKSLECVLSDEETYRIGPYICGRILCYEKSYLLPSCRPSTGYTCGDCQNKPLIDTPYLQLLNTDENLE